MYIPRHQISIFFAKSEGSEPDINDIFILVQPNHINEHKLRTASSDDITYGVIKDLTLYPG